jgi:hypothetical protein
MIRRRLWGGLFCSLLALALSGAGCSGKQQEAEPEVQANDVQPVDEPAPGGGSGTVIVKFAEGLEVTSEGTRLAFRPGAKSTLDAAAVAKASAELGTSVREAGVEEVRRVFSEGGERYVDGRDTLLYYALVLSADKDDAAADRLAEALATNPLVEEAHRQPVGQPAGLPKMTLP